MHRLLAGGDHRRIRQQGGGPPFPAQIQFRIGSGFGVRQTRRGSDRLHPELEPAEDNPSGIHECPQVGEGHLAGTEQDERRRFSGRRLHDRAKAQGNPWFSRKDRDQTAVLRKGRSVESRHGFIRREAADPFKLQIASPPTFSRLPRPAEVTLFTKNVRRAALARSS